MPLDGYRHAADPARSHPAFLEGRADGIFSQDDRFCIDEIKGVYKNLELMEEPVPVHRAQALCYAWIYLDEHELEEIDVQMTYVHLDTEVIKRFRETLTRAELRQWYKELTDSYHRWLAYQIEWRKKRNESMENLDFPFTYRKGQREMVSGIYHAISKKEQIFIQAPTGVGKTMSAVFPAVRAIGQGMAETVFYLTARTITRTVAQDAFEILRDRGLLFKVVTITAKEKLCFCDKPECDPEKCPYAKGHYDRINDAVYELWTTEQSFDRETLLRHAQKRQVCPFEMSLDLAIWMDGTTTPLTAGDIVCVPSHMPHRTLPTVHDNPAILFFTSFSNFHFKGMEPNRLDFPGGSSVLHTDGLVRQDITNLCLRMISERYSNQVGQYFMQKAYLTQLLMTIIRQITVPPKQSCSPVTFETHHKTYVVSEIRQYLSSHYAEKISLDLIARNMYLSSAYISKIFKEETGEAPINYLIKMRLERARIQLESDNGQSIKAISNSVGYDDVYYFSKLFKKYYGMSPVHYRSKYKKVV